MVGISALASVASAEIITVDLAGIASMDQWLDPDNVVMSLDIGENVNVTNISWSNVEGTTEGGYADSWGLHMQFAVYNSDFQGGIFSFFPFDGLGTAGGPWGPSDNSLNVSTIHANADGLFYLEFFDGFDNGVGADAFYTAGTLVITTDGVAVPAPATLALLGIAGIATRRRRS